MPALQRRTVIVEVEIETYSADSDGELIDQAVKPILGAVADGMLRSARIERTQ